MFVEKDVRDMSLWSFARPSSKPPRFDDSESPWALAGKSAKLVEPTAGKILRVPVDETEVDKLPNEVIRFPMRSMLAVDAGTRLFLHVAAAQDPRVTLP